MLGEPRDPSESVLVVCPDIVLELCSPLVDTVAHNIFDRQSEVDPVFGFHHLESMLLPVLDWHREPFQVRGHRHQLRGPLTVLTKSLGYPLRGEDRKSTRLNSSHVKRSYAVFS